MTRPLSAVLLTALVLFLGATGAKARESADSWAICARAAAVAERQLEIPRHLLAAIAQVESGRWHKPRAASLAWPWTVMAEGRGRYLPSKAAAVAEVAALKARGVENIDVGCMQINLRYHPDAFSDLEQAFDPAFNVAYGASFLVGLRAEARSWTRAVGLYHSRDAVAGNHYRRKVLIAWRTAQKAQGAPAPSDKQVAVLSRSDSATSSAQKSGGLPLRTGALQPVPSGRPLLRAIRAMPLLPQ